MTSEELYYTFHLLLNKNASLKNVNITRANFVILYNREAILWLDNFIRTNSSTGRIHDLEQLLSVNKELEVINKNSNYYEYFLPENYFHFVSSVSTASKGSCTTNVRNYLIKPKEDNTSLENELPSFEFEESVCNIADKKLLVYIGDYQINSTYLSYYIYPEKIDLEGYTDINTGKYSRTVDTDLDEHYQHQILNRVVLEVMRQFENSNGINISQTRLN